MNERADFHRTAGRGSKLWAAVKLPFLLRCLKLQASGVRRRSSCSGALYPALWCNASGGAASGTPEAAEPKVLLFVCA